MNPQPNDLDDYRPEGYNPWESQDSVEKDHSNRNKFVAAQTGKIK